MFVVAVGREPDVDEAADLDALCTQMTVGIPPVYAAALDALAVGVPACAPIDPSEASWDWTLYEVANALPGSVAAVVDDGLSLTLVPDGVTLTVRARPTPEWRVARRVAPSAAVLVPETEGRLRLEVPASLEGLVAACEVHCVAGCCGTGAFQVDAGTMAPWIARYGVAVARAAVTDLDAILAEVERASVPIVSRRFNAVWPPGQCAEWLRRWRSQLSDALVVADR